MRALTDGRGSVMVRAIMNTSPMKKQKATTTVLGRARARI